jgi:hypothetical protein
MASGAQPFERAAELAAIAAPTLLVPGADPHHPGVVAELYRRHLRHCTVRTVGIEDYASAIAEFLDGALS